MICLPAAVGLVRPGASPAGYLDGLPIQPIYAYSLKKIISTATVAVRVRRSSDDAEQDIGFIGNALDTSALASFVGAGSGFVTTFYDQAGNGYHLTQSTPSKQPSIVNAGTYGGIVSWDGTDDAMSAASVPLNQPQTAIFLDGTLPPYSGTLIYEEASANWNSNAYSYIMHSDTNFWHFGMNSGTPASNQKVVRFAGIAMGSRKVLSVLFDRTLAGTNQVRAWTNGSAATGAQVTGYTTDQTGSFGTHTHYMGARGGTSLYTAPTVFSRVTYNADVSSIRSSIEAILA